MIRKRNIPAMIFFQHLREPRITDSSLGQPLAVIGVIILLSGCATALPPELDKPSDTSATDGEDSDSHTSDDSADTASGTDSSVSHNTDSEVVDTETDSAGDTATASDSETETEEEADTGTEIPGECGDGFVSGTDEICDGDGAGHGGETASCDADCTEVRCNDKTVNPTAGEFCDDGNLNPGDGCDAECRAEGLSLGESSTSPQVDDTFANGIESGGECDADAAAIGIFGAYGQWFDVFGVRCQGLDSTFRLVGATHNADTVGSSGGGSPFGPLLCPAGELLVAITFEYNNHFRSAKGHCRSAAAIYAGADNQAWTSDTETAAAGGTDLERATISCPSGSVVTGVGGYDVDYPAGYPSAIHLICRQMAP